LSIEFATVDLTNSDAVNWYKSVVTQNLLVDARAAGWMHDFGESLPFDAVLHSGIDPIEYHNQYPADWA